MYREVISLYTEKAEEDQFIIFSAGSKCRSHSENFLFISAKEHTHVNLLKKELVDKVTSGNLQTENVIITNARHFEALQKVNDALVDIRKGMDEKIPGDLIALDIRRCLHYLGEITGQITNEDQLDYIFSKFCIGK